jgi:hypothetical protein
MDEGEAVDPDWDDYIEEPIADPAIRADYQDALGRFIMAHNEVDFWMRGILSKAVKMLAFDGSLNGLAMGDFAQRATNLAVLMKVAPHLALGGVGNNRLAELNGVRNVLAHGHFDQDPYEGTYEIVRQRHKSLKAERLKNLNAETINTQAEELEKIAGHMSAVFDFIDHPVPLEHVKDPIVHMSTELWQAMQAAKNGEAAAGLAEQPGNAAAAGGEGLQED